MKHLLSTAIPSIIFMGGLLFVSCSNEEDLSAIQPSTDAVELITTKINLSCEYSTSVSDMTASAAKANEGSTTSEDLYGVQIFTKNATDSVPYAHGLFDDPDKISVELIKSNKYIVYCRLIKNGKKTLRYYDNETKYTMPFDLQPWGEGINGVSYLTKGMEFSISQYMYNLPKHWGSAFCETQINPDCSEPGITGKYYDHPDVESYDGEIHNYDPTSGSLTINLRKVFFGVKLNVSDLSEGSLTLSINGAKSFQILSTDESKIKSKIITFDGGTIDWTKDDYSETINTKAVYKNGSGIETILFNQDLTFYRNKETTINVTIPSTSATTSKSANINTETSDMTASGTNYEF